jgi:hypothetical protein
MSVAVLFARQDSVYKTLPDLDVYDSVRDARTWLGGCPVIAHPPCRAWGRLRSFANPRPDEKELAFFALDAVRKNGGVLEHPKGSTLWDVASLPLPGSFDEFGGFTFPVFQNAFGHRAEKPTLLFIVGCSPVDIPAHPIVLGEASHIIGSSGRRSDGSRLRKGDAGWRPEVTKAEREHTPLAFAYFLVSIARIVQPPKSVRVYVTPVLPAMGVL